MSIVFVDIELMEQGVKLPSYAKEGDSGMDLRIIENYLIQPGETKTLRTGIKLAIPEGYEVQVRPRSGISANTKLRVLLGTIDSGYRGEIGIICDNIGTTNIWLMKGDRVAQMVIQEVPKVVLKLKYRLDETERGDGGFGSSGVK